MSNVPAGDAFLMTCCKTVSLAYLYRYLYIVCSGRVQTLQEGSRWMTSSELFLCTPRAALENDSSFALTLKEQVGESNFCKYACTCVERACVHTCIDYSEYQRRTCLTEGEGGRGKKQRAWLS